MKSLVIAEKPSVARDIARVLGANQKNGGILEGKNYVVTWALGHLVTLADPEEYDRKYEKWEMATLPMLPKEMKLVVIRQTGRQFSVVKTQLFRKDIGEIIIATDAGREGELVARWILEKAGCHKPIKRLWISSVTDKAIKEGFANLKDGHDYDNLYRAAVARAEADWLVGMNGTRALTCKYNAQLSCGRVQTPTLAMIAKREEEIRKFVPKEYYGISLETQDVKWTWRDEKTKSFRTFSRERAEQIKGRLENAALEITSVEKKAKKTMAPGLYDLTTLQREANLKYGFSAKETLNIMQRLYENHKVLTYPRTDSRYIGKDIVPTIKERLKACGIGPYRKLAGALMNKPVQVNGSFVDDKRVSDHHAIIPTEQFVQLDHMTNEERKIYDMVVRRFLAVLYPASQYEQVTMEAKAAGETFAASGKVIKSMGWKEVYEGGADDDLEDEADDEKKLKDQRLPEMKTGTRLKILKTSLNTGKTKPPARFTEATLLAAMENPVKFMETRDNEAVKTLKGIPTKEDFLTTVDLDVDAFIPPSYIVNEVQKLDIYKRIAGIENQAECDDMKEELLDRFGVIPTEADNLLRIALIRVAAHKLDMIDVKGKNSQIVFTLKDDAQIQVQNIPMLLGRVEHLSFNPKMRCFVFHYQKCGMVEKDERQLLAYTEELLQTMQECLTVQPCHS